MTSYMAGEDGESSLSIRPSIIGVMLLIEVRAPPPLRLFRLWLMLSYTPLSKMVICDMYYYAHTIKQVSNLLLEHIIGNI